MGGRGGSSGFSATVDGYNISNGEIITRAATISGVSSYRALNAKEQKAVERSGKNLTNPVWAGGYIMPKAVAEEAIRQNQALKARFEKNVPGLRELEEARSEADYATFKFKSGLNSRYGAVVSRDVEQNKRAADEKVRQLEKKYPRAVAYKKAQALADSSNYEMSRIGKEAMDAIASGKSYKKVLEEMERKRKKNADAHIWD